jgi:hypothetical protein
LCEPHQHGIGRNGVERETNGSVDEPPHESLNTTTGDTSRLRQPCPPLFVPCVSGSSFVPFGPRRADVINTKKRAGPHGRRNFRIPAVPFCNHSVPPVYVLRTPFMSSSRRRAQSFTCILFASLNPPPPATTGWFALAIHQCTYLRRRMSFVPCAHRFPLLPPWRSVFSNSDLVLILMQSQRGRIQRPPVSVRSRRQVNLKLCSHRSRQ